MTETDGGEIAARTICMSWNNCEFPPLPARAGEEIAARLKETRQ